eukprot:scpid35622/ scgid22673/ Conserved oligomeric Golgi complex subunit 6; Component of oligomeric Golgi complex 6
MASQAGPQSSQQQSNPLTKKLNKVLSSRLDSDKELLEALQGLSAFFTDNSLRTRRNLRGDIERRSLAINEEFAAQFTDVKKQLDGIHEEVQEMSRCCADMSKRLQSVKSHTSDLISQTSKLRAEGSTLDLKLDVANSFNSMYLLTNDEMQSLRGAKSANGDIERGFFMALGRVKEIHGDCKSLLRVNHQNAGLEIMESMALHQEAAFEKLYRWSQSESRSLTGDSPEISSLFCLAAGALQDRPVLFKYAMEEVAISRRAAVVRCFIDALTRGGVGGTPRPIELHSHDPLRYVGDMLAWLHQALAMEKEMLLALVDKVEQQVATSAIQLTLRNIAEGICRPFKVRVEQVLVNQPGPVIVYQLAGLLYFYHSTISVLLAAESEESTAKTLATDGKPSTSILATLMELRQLAQKMFFNNLTIHASKLLEKVELPTANLSPPTALTETLTLLKSILLSQDVTVVPLEARQEDFTKILSCLLDPLLQVCALSASTLKKSAEMAVFLINCIYQIESTLAIFEFSDTRVEALKGQTEAHMDTLVHEQMSFILTKVGLADIYNTIQQVPADVQLSSLPGMDPATVGNALINFDSFLSAPDNSLLPEVKLLYSSKIRESVHNNAAKSICQVYRVIYSALSSPDASEEYRQGGVGLGRTPEQVSALLVL